MRRREVYSDGSCAQVPPERGEGAWAWCVPEGFYYRSGYEPRTTGTRAELQAALEAVTFWTGPLVLYTDSQMIVRCWQNKTYEEWSRQDWMHSWRPQQKQARHVKNRDLWEPLTEEFRTRGNEIIVRWVKGHSNNRWNNYADTLARRARLTKMGEERLPTDPGTRSM